MSGPFPLDLLESVIFTPNHLTLHDETIFSLVAVALLGSAAWGQTMVTLTVDMTNEMVSADGVHVAGNFQGWDPGATPMTDNMDGTWSYSFSSDTAATYQYKFINGNAWDLTRAFPVPARTTATARSWWTAPWAT